MLYGWKIEATYITCWTRKYIRQYLNRLQRISYVPKEIWVLMLAKGTECRLLLPNLFNEIVDGVEVSQDIYWLMALTFKFLFGLFEQLSQLYIGVVTIRLSNRECHREFRHIGITASGKAESDASNRLGNGYKGL